MLVGTAVTLSCVITDINNVVTVLWKKSRIENLGAGGVTGYTVDQGTYNSGSQTSTLALTGDVNTEDMRYTCVVTPQDNRQEIGVVIAEPSMMIVNLNVFSK